MKGFLVDWNAGKTTGSFDLDVRGKLMHFEMDMRQITIDGLPASHWSRDVPSPFRTPNGPARLCALVVYYGIGNYYRKALTITITHGEGTSRSDNC